MLCRACGAEVLATEYCQLCNEAVLWKCSSCEKETERSVHTYHPITPDSSRRAASVVGTLIGLVSGVHIMMPL